MKCPYCGRDVTPNEIGNCPKCKALLPEEIKKPNKIKEDK